MLEKSESYYFHNIFRAGQNSKRSDTDLNVRCQYFDTCIQDLCVFQKMNLALFLNKWKRTDVKKSH